MYNADLEFSTNVTLHHILAGVTERDTVRYRIFWASKIGFLRSILEVRGDRPLVELPGASHFTAWVCTELHSGALQAEEFFWYNTWVRGN